MLSVSFGAQPLSNAVSKVQVPLLGQQLSGKFKACVP